MSIDLNIVPFSGEFQDELEMVVQSLKELFTFMGKYPFWEEIVYQIIDILQTENQIEQYGGGNKMIMFLFFIISLSCSLSLTIGISLMPRNQNRISNFESKIKTIVSESFNTISDISNNPMNNRVVDVLSSIHTKDYIKFINTILDILPVISDKFKYLELSAIERSFGILVLKSRNPQDLFKLFTLCIAFSKLSLKLIDKYFKQHRELFNELKMTANPLLKTATIPIFLNKNVNLFHLIISKINGSLGGTRKKKGKKRRFRNSKKFHNI